MNETFLASSLSVSVTTGCTDHGGGQPDYSYWSGGGKRRRRFFRPRLACSLFSAEDCKCLGVWACSGYHLLRVRLTCFDVAALYTAVHGAIWPKKPTKRAGLLGWWLFAPPFGAPRGRLRLSQRRRRSCAPALAQCRRGPSAKQAKRAWPLQN